MITAHHTISGYKRSRLDDCHDTTTKTVENTCEMATVEDSDNSGRLPLVVALTRGTPMNCYSDSQEY